MRVHHAKRFFTLTCLSAFRTDKDLVKLSELGHFLKGSSAALGVFKVQSSCEKIQNFGRLRNDDVTITEAEAIVKIRESILRAKKEYKVAEGWLKGFLKTYPSE